MPSPRKPKPSFDIQPATPADPGWVYRTEPEAPEKPEKRDLSRALPKNGRDATALEQALDLISLPFQIVIMIGLVPLGLGKRRG